MDHTPYALRHAPNQDVTFRGFESGMVGSVEVQ